MRERSKRYLLAYIYIDIPELISELIPELIPGVMPELVPRSPAMLSCLGGDHSK